MKKIFYIISLFALASCSDSISDFQSDNFIKFFGNGEGSDVNSVVETSNGYVFTGYNSSNGRKQVFVAKVDNSGNTLWSNTMESDSIQQGLCIKPLSDGTYIVAGRSQSTSSSNPNPMLMQVGENGLPIWTKYINYDGSLQINDICVIDQSIMIAGEALASGATSTNFFAANYSTSGDKVWHYTSITSGAFKRIIVTNDNICYFIGNDTYSSVPNITINKISQNNPISNITRKISFDQNFTGIADIEYANQNLYILVSDKTNGAKVLKLDANFDDVWTSTTLLGSEIGITPKSLTLRNNNTLLVGGNLNNSIVLFGIDNNGNSTSSNLYRNFYGSVNTTLTTSDGGLLIAGSTSETYYEMMQLIKTDVNLYLLEQ